MSAGRNSVEGALMRRKAASGNTSPQLSLDPVFRGMDWMVTTTRRGSDAG